MQGLTLFNLNLTHLLDAFLETAVPMIAGLAEVVGLFIIITSLAKATFYYVRATFFNDHRDFHHEMSSGLTTALEFLMSAEIAKYLLLQNLESVVPLAAYLCAARFAESAAARGEWRRPPPTTTRKDSPLPRTAKRADRQKICQTLAGQSFTVL